MVHEKPLAQLLNDCRAGDDAAWREFVDRHSRLVYSIARRAGLDQAEAEDAMQDVFLAAFRSLDRIEDPDALPKWLIVTTSRRCRRGPGQRPRPLDGLVDPATADEPSTETWEAFQNLHAALDQLSPSCRDLLIALFGPGVEANYDQVAAQLGIPRGSIGPTRRRCLSRLAAILAGGAS